MWEDRGGIDCNFVNGVLHDPVDCEMARSINEIGYLRGSGQRSRT